VYHHNIYKLTSLNNNMNKTKQNKLNKIALKAYSNLIDSLDSKQITLLSNYERAEREARRELFK